MADRRFEEFEAKVDDKNIKFRVYEPTVEQDKEANKIRNQYFLEALQAKAPLRAQLNTLLRSRGEWDDERQRQYDEYQKTMYDCEKTLKAGGIKLEDAKKVALSLKETRTKMIALLSDRSSLEAMTCEGLADNAKFNALVALCLVYITEDGKELKYFNSVDEYLTGNSIISNLAAQKLAYLLYSIGEDIEQSLPENKFLLKYKFVDEKLRLINKDGHLIDVDGRLINEYGNYVDEKGNLVDKFGTPINDVGEYAIDTKPFLDEDGKEIVEEPTVVTSKKTKSVKSTTTE